MRRYLRHALLCLLGSSSAASAQSQSADALVNKMFDVVSRASTNDEFPGTLIGAIGSQLSNYPVGTSSGGFTYTFDSSLGIVGRSTRSFGPAFAERALTVGQGKFSFGFNFQQARFNRFEGEDLTALELCCSVGSASIDLGMTLTSQTAAVVMQAGLLPRLDVGVVIPVVRVNLDAVVLRVGPFGNSTYAATESRSGIGDIVLKTKYNFFRRAGGGVAAAADLRLPTGDKLNCLGRGASQLKVYGIGSAEVGAFAPHVNIGMTTGSNETGPCDTESIGECYLRSLSREFNFAGGVDIIASRHLTLLVDVVGRSIPHARRYGYWDDGLFDEKGFSRLTTLLGSTGAKVNLGGTFLLTASVLFPLNNAGLASRLATTIGFDYAF